MISHAGRTLLPALAALVIGGGVLFVSETTWLQVAAALVMVVGIALGVFAIATPEFLESDQDRREGEA